MTDLTQAALGLATQFVMDLNRHERTSEQFRVIAERVAEMLSNAGDVPVDAVVKRLEADFDVWVPQAIVVSDPGDHVPWLDERRQQIDFPYWRRYAAWLGRKSWKPSTIEALGESTDQVLGLLEDPHRSGSWKTYGMVYGQVQSGKTASYTGVICKAVDAGYRVVVVLTSQLESLRHQTQARLDLEFLGLNSKFAREADNSDSSVVIGVGTLGMKSPGSLCQPLTTQASDFTAAQFQGSPVNINEVCVLVVAKKNARILNNLKDWLNNFATNGTDGDKLVRNAPLLLIDDEADYASVDTKRPGRGRTQSDLEHDPTAINRSVRGILELFEQRVYLAYTATPFANIFIPEKTEHPEWGQDLFPRSFLVALEPPSNYCGPEVVFGLEDPEAADIREPLPVIRTVDDYEPWLPDGHRKGDRPGGKLPPSLVHALDSFVLATAVRKVRSRDEDVAGGHSTMLVHVTRFTDVQGEVARQIEEHLRDTANAWIDYGRVGAELRERLEQVWAQDFQATYADMSSRADVSAFVGPPVSWGNVEQFVGEVLEEVSGNVRRINGTAADVLDYQLKTPVTVVAVGGDKLSRGLTLEGLTVSYYLRTSRAYDTLLQMGRWFGYRPGYLDVTRLYTTSELVGYYVHITRANRELMDLATAVARAKQTPRHVGLRVLDSPGNLQVTAAPKMRASHTMMVSFSGTRAETLVMRTDKTAQKHNHEKLLRLIEEITPHGEVPANRVNSAGRGFFRCGIPADVVIEFLEGFAVSPRVLTADPENLVPYIRSQANQGELTNWTVAITGGSAGNKLEIEGRKLPMVQRRTITHPRVLDRECEVGVLVSPSHETLDLSAGIVDRAYEITAEAFRSAGRRQAPKRPSGDSLRQLRDPDNGLLLIYPIDPESSDIKGANPAIPIVGYSVVFPRSDRARPVQYRVNETFLNNLRKAVDEEEEADEE